MATNKYNTIFSSDYSEQRWVDRISKNFNKEIFIDIKCDDAPVCVFTVPKSISEMKPEAYVPQVVGLGPYHHMEPHLYQMERYKIATVKAFLKPDQISDFQSLVINRLVELEIIVRGCYHKYLELDDESLAWIVAIDALFLLDVLRDNVDTRGRKMTRSAVLSRDIMVLENQIPFVILKEIRKTLGLSPPNDCNDVELFCMMRVFCQEHSPLKLAEKSRHWPDTSHLHLLDLMYHMILAHGESELIPQEEGDDEESTKSEVVVEKEVIFDNVGEILDVGMRLGVVNKFLKPVEVIQNVPWDKISNILGIKTVNHDGDEENPHVEEIKIPSVSSLQNYGDINFSHTVGGIRDVRFVEEEATLYLPAITLSANSEVVLRNLVAFEASISHSNLKLAQYVDLICGIVDTAEDAKILKDMGIIKGELTNEQTAKLFNGINKFGTNSSNKTVEKINKFYREKPLVKASRFIRSQVYYSWRALTILSTIVLFILLGLYSFCQFYGCRNYFSSSS